MKILIMLLMFAILWTCGTFALSYIVNKNPTASNIVNCIAFYSRILVSIIFCAVVMGMCWFILDMSRIFLNVGVNAYGHMVVVDLSSNNKTMRLSAEDEP